ncbi:serine/arginine repetitive matrix protein 1-like [Dromiciops gliroides]|uniref:serine/arginine repetitive matrix protein 1-like n=1 Tax=Dromiciops gliroides TaxID=33562 RepID=UPI001CC55FC4|nr:serine/arginine repetitive matrix protein 1-like [Dromiciops gliroides]
MGILRGKGENVEKRGTAGVRRLTVLGFVGERSPHELLPRTTPPQAPRTPRASLKATSSRGGGEGVGGSPSVATAGGGRGHTREHPLSWGWGWGEGGPLSPSLSLPPFSAFRTHPRSARGGSRGCLITQPPAPYSFRGAVACRRRKVRRSRGASARPPVRPPPPPRERGQHSPAAAAAAASHSQPGRTRRPQPGADWRNRGGSGVSRSSLRYSPLSPPPRPGPDPDPPRLFSNYRGPARVQFCALPPGPPQASFRACYAP